MNPRRILVAALLVASLALSGCSVLSDFFDRAVRDDDGTISESGDLDVFSLKVGDCFGGVATETETASVTAIPCDQPHVYEVFHDFELPAGDLPSATAVETAVYDACDPAFEEFVGVDYEHSTLEYFYFSPTQEGWDSMDDRLVTCIIGTDGVEVTGSAAGSQS